MKWAETNKYKIVIAGARDAWMVADELGAAKIPVVYEATFALPGHDTESYDVCYRQAEVLRKAGVKVVFCGGPGNFWAALAKNTPYFASQAVAFGYPRERGAEGIDPVSSGIAGGGRSAGIHHRGKGSDGVRVRWGHSGPARAGDADVDCREGSEPRESAYAALREI